MITEYLADLKVKTFFAGCDGCHRVEYPNIQAPQTPELFLRKCEHPQWPYQGECYETVPPQTAAAFKAQLEQNGWTAETLHGRAYNFCQECSQKP